MDWSVSPKDEIWFLRVPSHFKRSLQPYHKEANLPAKLKTGNAGIIPDGKI
jgi:hypothetical protein